MITDPLDVFTPKRGRNPRLERLRYYRRDMSRRCSCWMCQFTFEFNDIKHYNPNRGSRIYNMIYAIDEDV